MRVPPRPQRALAACGRRPGANGFAAPVAGSRLNALRRLVAAEPALGGKRGSPPRAIWRLVDDASWVPLGIVSLRRPLAVHARHRADSSATPARAEPLNQWALASWCERKRRGSLCCSARAAPFSGWRPDEAPSRRSCDARQRRSRSQRLTRKRSHPEVARRSSCASRAVRPPAGERSTCEPKHPPRRAHFAKRSRISPASAAVGAPTSGAAGVGRAPGARSAKREHAGPCHAVQRRGIKSLLRLRCWAG